MAITALPTPPRRDTPDSFADDGDAFLGALPTFATEANALAVEVNAASASAISASESASTSADVALAASNYRGDYSAGVTYAVGESVDYAGSRWLAKTSNLGVTPVSGANWTQIFAIPQPIGAAGEVLISDGSTLSWGKNYRVEPENRTSNTILGVADKGKFINITSGTFSQTFTAAATLGAGWFIYIRNAGSGVITLDPNASEQIDGVTSGTIVRGDTYLVACTGTAFITNRLSSGVTVEVKTSGTSWVCPIGVRNVKVTVVGGGGGYGSSTYGVGGGGGAAIRQYAVTPGTSYTYAVGAGGTTTAGGNSTFTDGTTLITGSGGGIWSGNSEQFTPEAAGGSATNGQLNIQGERGIYTTRPVGGNSILGFGATLVTYPSNAASAATGYGGGGFKNNQSTGGTSGVVIFEY